jgi:DDE superfamily endonuclease
VFTRGGAQQTRSANHEVTADAPVSLPRSVTCLLDRFRGCFTAPTFTTFCGLALGFWALPGLHTVTGMLCGARLQQAWHHSRAHRFFSAARWSADQLGLVLLDLILATLIPDGAPVRLVCDDTLMRRVGRKVFGAAWHHDPLAPGRHRVAWANNWVAVGVLVDLPMLPHRPVCLPILARLWQPKHTAGRLGLAVDLVRLICQHLGARRVDLLVDGAYAGKALRELPAQVTVCCRLRADARLHRLPSPRRPGTRGRPRTKGDRLPELVRLAGMVTTPFTLLRVTRYGQGGLAAVAFFTCLWPSVFGPRPVHVVLVRAPDAPDGFDLALVSTDLRCRQPGPPPEPEMRNSTTHQSVALFGLQGLGVVSKPLQLLREQPGDLRTRGADLGDVRLHLVVGSSLLCAVPSFLVIVAALALCWGRAALGVKRPGGPPARPSCRPPGALAGGGRLGLLGAEAFSGQASALPGRLDHHKAERDQVRARGAEGAGSRACAAPAATPPSQPVDLAVAAAGRADQAGADLEDGEAALAEVPPRLSVGALAGHQAASPAGRKRALPGTGQSRCGRPAMSTNAVRSAPQRSQT